MWEFIAGYLFGSADRGSERNKKPGGLIGLLWVVMAVAGILAYSVFDITLVQAMWSTAAAVGVGCGVIAVMRGFAFEAFIMIASACAFAYTVFLTDLFGSPDLPCRQDQHMPWEKTRDCLNASDSLPNER